MYQGQQSHGGLALPRMTPAVKVLLLINAGVFVLNLLVWGALSDPKWFALSGSGLWDGFGLGVLRFGTYQFTHSFYDPLHLGFNMLVLYFFGTFVEARVGRKGMYWLYLLSGLVGGLLHIVLAAVFGHGIPVIGASGACYGIMVYAAFMAPRMRVILIVFPIELRFLVGILVFVGLYQTVLMLGGAVSGGQVSHGAHLGGALWGFIGFKMASAGFSPEGWLSSRRAQSSARKTQRKQEVLDELLEKVHRQGMAALTPAERRFLERVSKGSRK